MPTEQEKVVDTMRLASMATGRLYDVQILNLKCIPLVVFGEELLNEFKIDFDKKNIVFELKGKADFPEDETQVRFEHLVQYVQRLMGNFKVQVTLNGKILDGKPVSTTGKTRKKPNGNRKKRVSKVRKGK